jgi:hypothetical protein
LYVVPLIQNIQESPIKTKRTSCWRHLISPCIYVVLVHANNLCLFFTKVSIRRQNVKKVLITFKKC